MLHAGGMTASPVVRAFPLTRLVVALVLITPVVVRVAKVPPTSRQSSRWLSTEPDHAFVASLMQPVTTPGKMASWIAPPTRGIHGQPLDYAYVTFN